MAIVKSKWAKGERTWIRPQTHGAVHTTTFSYDVGVEGALAAGDILELGVIPPYARITEATIITEGTFTGITADVGVMSGDLGAATNADGSARTVGNEFYAAADLTVAVANLSKSAALLLTPVEYERSIGVKVSGAVAAAAGKRIHLKLFYHQ